ncbi:HpcH/HpaI aldolase/citrate lyase family protein [Oceanobacillus jeddahense]|uniref:CoA ester lyase n=1 Tax=Oceanobacillus jeddahense TaxID=1462527 RepID=A0ABY5JTF4_9BACI|nr:CoA ester lyase [Oceanobacillus jeddahense]UUI02468.1 CoA ester lyase [Oceanobacillus jeddahense]
MLSRSLLFIPADKEKILLKINSLNADVIILDLEDAISLNHKQYARQLIKKHFHNIQKPTILRINSLDTDEHPLDMNLVAEIAAFNHFQGVMLPKALNKNTIEQVANHLHDIEKKHNKKISIIPLIESASGVKNAYEIAGADNRVTQLAFGGVDFVNDIDAQATAEEHELFYARSEIIISSRSAGLDKPIDTVYVNFKDTEGFYSNCSYVKKLGFGGKLLIHPSQVDIANEVFSPSEKEVEEAKLIIDNIHEDENIGTFQLDGKMVDKPVIEKAQRTLNDYQEIINYSGR